MSTIIPFGKHRGATIEEIPVGYLQWMIAAGRQDRSSALGRFVTENLDAIEEAIASEQKNLLAGVSFDYTLNPSQRSASDTLQDWLINSPERCAKLEGGAGYGKSFTVLDVVRNAIEAGYQVAAAATSYVATQVLDTQLGGIGIPCRTLASSLKLTVEHDGPRTDYVWDYGASDSALAMLLGPRRLFIVDEYSMVSDDIGFRLMEFADTHGGKLLCVGDLKQLPPVGQNTPSVLSGIAVSTELTQPMRYSADSDLFGLEQSVRQQGARASITASEHISLHRGREALLEAYVAAQRARPADDNRVLFFRRRDVVAANAYIRAELFGQESALKAVIGDEKLMVMATIDVRPLNRDESKRYYSGTSYRVVKQHQEEFTCEEAGFTFEVDVVTLENGDVLPVMFMETETKADTSKLGGLEYTQCLTAIARQCEFMGNWTSYRAFKSRFLPVGYGYAMTVHRCQGQTVDRVFFEAGSLMAGAMTDALMYVAATRAKEEVHVVPRVAGD